MKKLESFICENEPQLEFETESSDKNSEYESMKAALKALLTKTYEKIFKTIMAND